MKGKEAKVPVDPTIRKTCKNCGHEDTGRFCSECGQDFVNYNRPLKEAIHDLAGIFSLDASIFRTIVPFLIKPGFLSQEYLDGRRKKYMSPLKLYIFLSIVFFFVAGKSTINSIGSNDNINFTLSNDSLQSSIVMDQRMIDSLKLDSSFLRSDLDTAELNEANIKREEQLREGLISAAENQPLYVTDLLENISYSLFILMPLFALILQLLYIRRKKYYIEHLIFSINMHSFTLLILTLVTLLRLIIKGGDNFVLILALVIPVYFVAGMKKFYKQNLFKTILKTVLLGLIYIIPLFATLTGLALLTLMRM